MTKINLIQGVEVETRKVSELPEVVGAISNTDLVPISDEDGKLKKITYEDFSAPFVNGIRVAEPDTDPTDFPDTEIFTPAKPGDYVNFPNEGGTFWVVALEDLEQYYILFKRYNNPLGIGYVWAMQKQFINSVDETKLEPIELGSLIPSTGKLLLHIEGSYKSNSLAILPAQFTLPGLINWSTGEYSAASGRLATDFIDISGYEYLTHSLPTATNSLYGTAFYDETYTVMVGGARNDGTLKNFKIPAGAKYARLCTTSSDPLKTAELYSNFILKENEKALIIDGVIEKWIIKNNAIEFAQTDKAKAEALAYEPGTYLVAEKDFDLSGMVDGYVQWGSGEEAASTNYKRTGFLDIINFDGIEVSGVINGQNSVTFYNAASTANFMSGTTGLAADGNTPYFYAKPVGATHARVTMNNTTTNRFIKAKKFVTIEENQIAFIKEGNALIYTGGGGSVPISGDELIADLPVSDGTSIGSGNAYIETSSRNVKVKA